MKKRNLLLSFIILIFLFFIGKGIVNMLWYGPIYNVKTFSIFYGKPDQEKIDKLTDYDAVIIEPTAFTTEQVNLLKASDVKVFGYVSLMQLENWNNELKEHIAASDYATLNGKKIYIKEWDTYVMDLRESHYREALKWKINHYIADNGFDGIFFDTVDDLDYYFHDDIYIQKQMREGYVKLLKDIKSDYPNMLIMQNRGFETIKTASHDYIDGMLWEGFEAKDMTESEWAKNWLTYFKKEQRWGRIKVWTVVTDEESLALSKKHRFPTFMRVGDTYQE
ncbi:endo alpha-1,4 polygalactosaminidase [Metabacillus halosaccharovorans]|uniref:endo alpha-1,4 polygalactosaminidase n=1 Tax=Metabacillus halosaccharovorans TaxID=930124 RepID=UPI001C1F5DD4|nr:endo alpha-1,4 polygalactosaminidase [Metabacillus halosaccharovorans]MBU7594441.1 endo alpha-1,4 polygalactosaminidase [Metabacillus halosaccharovorans]